MAQKNPSFQEAANGNNNSSSEELSSFLESGIFRLDDGSRVVFVDPVRLLNRSYSRFRVSPSGYYSRSFKSRSKVRSIGEEEEEGIGDDAERRGKKKKRKRKSRELNEREICAEIRHQELRPLLLKAYNSLLTVSNLLSCLPNIVEYEDGYSNSGREEHNFVELGNLCQAPHYEISLCFNKGVIEEAEDSWPVRVGEWTIVPLFDNLIGNETTEDVEAEFLNSKYILPPRSSFYMSDLRRVRDLVPVHSDHGFNLIVIDPPWENGSVYQKAVYPTLPNRYFLYLPVKQLAHTAGALVVLWMTNREKLRLFVEKELFPTWGVTNVTTHYWLKVKPDGSLISELDLFHHRPYESLVVGYVNVKSAEFESTPSFTYMQDNQVFISIPGSHSRKPPLAKLLLDHVPGRKPAKCIELFARELVGGWMSWGNEPLRFQDSRYFIRK
ncbi:methyltransferase-like protein 2 [Iris pallida]|uniref:Methyltransferase-like protein 2 n=1 Tax=Iris pallida TaxID=29817 RepID=A0AAX6FAF8_IRIPA|nr:methyltransferase-like protein 2 [Iris pallida]KAJ6812905.1 methyltransferase-like protein 2 [Iris pallida]